MRWISPSEQEIADIAVITVGWNVKDLLQKNMEALFATQGTQSARLILVDNASHDGTVQMVQERFPMVEVIANAHNAGFSVAVNQGIVVRRARHVLLLNPDMHVEPEALSRTVDYLDTHSDVAVLGGRLATEDGRICPHVRRFPDFFSQWAIVLKVPHLFPVVLNHYLFSDFDYEKEQAVDSVRGSYFAISEHALRALGGLDTRYFIWFEEVDYCRQAHERGWKVMYVPSIRAVDYVGRSFKQVTRYWSQKQFTRSMVQYFEKWHPGWQAFLLSSARPLGLALAWGIDYTRSLRSKEKFLTPS